MNIPNDFGFSDLARRKAFEHRHVSASIEPLHTQTPALVQILDIVFPVCGAIGLFVGLVAELVGR